MNMCHAENLFHNGCTKTTNLIESYNKQINDRLKTIQGFQSFETVERAGQTMAIDVPLGEI